MDKRTLAIDCYIQALQKSVYLTEALDALMQHEMLMAWEETDLIQHIMPAPQNGNEADLQILKYLYESKLKKYYTIQNQASRGKFSWTASFNSKHSCRAIIQRRRQTTRNWSTALMRRSGRVNCSIAESRLDCQHQQQSKVQQKLSRRLRTWTWCRRQTKSSLSLRTHQRRHSQFSRVFLGSQCWTPVALSMSAK